MWRKWIRILPVIDTLALTSAAPAADKVILTQPVDSLSFFPIYVGRIKGFFKEEGLTLDVKATAGGGPHLTAVLADKAEFTASPGTYQLNALNSGKRAIGFVDLLRRNIIGMVIHKDAAKKAGIKDGIPLMDKVKRAKGLKIGMMWPGEKRDRARDGIRNGISSPEQFARKRTLCSKRRLGTILRLETQHLTFIGKYRVRSMPFHVDRPAQGVVPLRFRHEDEDVPVDARRVRR